MRVWGGRDEHIYTHLIASPEAYETRQAGKQGETSRNQKKQQAHLHTPWLSTACVGLTHATHATRTPHTEELVDCH